MFKPTLFKSTISLLVAISFLMMAAYGLTVMTHGPNGLMPNDCPFSIPGTSLCPQNVETANMPINLGVIASLIPYLLAAYVSLALLTILPLVFALPVKKNFKSTSWLAFKSSPF